MAKKIKPNKASILNSSFQEKIEEKPNILNTNTSILNMNTNKNSKANKTEELINKEEQYEKIDQLNKDLISENENLKVKLEEYIVENNTMKNSIKELTELIESLKKENEKITLSISELTFDNAKLLNQIQNLTNKDNPQNKNICKVQQTFSQTQRYRKNGYTDWN